jgi:hypothetical protein
MLINDATKQLIRARAEYLALACRRCDERRYNFVTGVDPETQETVPIFNPRLQRWAEHFIWVKNGVVIEGITQIRRATCARLDLRKSPQHPKRFTPPSCSQLNLQSHPFSHLPIPP